MTPEFWSIPASPLTASELAEKTATLKHGLLSITEKFSDVRFATSLAAEDMAVSYTHLTLPTIYSV